MLQVSRAVAANLVVLSHLDQFESRYAGGALSPFAPYSEIGVDLFFVLSGFIMVAVAGRNVGAFQFLWQRATRIYPTYWLATLVMLGVAAAMPGTVHESFEPISIWRSFLLVADTAAPVVNVGWTLVNEVYFYVVFAILLSLRIPPIIGITVWGIAIAAISVASPQYIAEFPVLQVATSPLTLEFMTGIVLGVIWLTGRTPLASIAGIVGLISLIWAVPAHYYLIAKLEPIHDSSQLWRVFLFGLPFALILYALLAFERRASWRPPALLVAIGDWSYSTYLFHFMILSVVGRAVLVAFLDRGAAASIILFIIGFMAANVGGALVYWSFERPVLRMFRNRYALEGAGLRWFIKTGSSTQSG